MTKSIKTKLTLFIFACLVIAFIVSGFIAYSIVNRNTKADVEQRLHELGKKQVELLDEWIDEQKEKAVVFSNEAQVVSFIKDPASGGDKVYAKLIKHLEYVRDEYGLKGIFVADNQGVVRATTETEMEHINVSDFPYFKNAIDKELYVSGITPSEFPVLNEYGQYERKTPTLFVSTVIKDINYKTVGVLCLRLDTVELNRQLQRLNFGESSDTYLVNSEGIMLTNSRAKPPAKRVRIAKAMLLYLIMTKLRKH